MNLNIQSHLKQGKHLIYRLRRLFFDCYKHSFEEILNNSLKEQELKIEMLVGPLGMLNNEQHKKQALKIRVEEMKKYMIKNE